MIKIATRWKDQEITGQLIMGEDGTKNIIENIIDKVINNVKEGKLDDDEESIKQSYITNWKVDKRYGTTQNANFMGEDIEYNIFDFSFQKMTKQTGDVSNHKGFYIIYTKGNDVYYISSRNWDSQTILRKLLGYTGREEIVSNSFEIKNDFIYWMIFKVYSQDNNLEIDGENRKLRIEDIKAFKGDSVDMLTRVSADGESVLNTLSTLAFLLERGKIDSIVVDIDYTEEDGTKHESLEVVLNTSNYPSLDIDTYIGDYDKIEFKDYKEGLLYLLLFLELLTDLTQVYMEEIDNGLWGEEIYKEFILTVADDVKEKATSRVSDL